MHQSSGFTVRLLPLLISAAFSSQALAAEEATEEVLEEVIVTAQKRAERLQDVPLSVTAISGSQLENRGIRSAADLNALAPNVTVKSAQPGSGLTAALNIRGIGGGMPAIWSDSAIGMYLDGAYIGKTQGALLDMLELERVEVLRGPQGTLFGKNTEGGAINFITRKPSGEFGGIVGFDVGSRGHQVAKASIDLPQMGIMKLGFSLRDERRDGTVNNPNGPKWNNRNRNAQRLAASFDISRDLKVDYAYDHTDIDETPTAISLYDPQGYANLYPATFIGVLDGYFGAALRPMITPYASKSYPTSIASDPGQEYFTKLKASGHALTVNYALNGTNNLKYILSKRKMHYREMLDLDGTPIHVFNAGKDTFYDTSSHELQWVGNTERMNYVAGLYLFEDDGYTLTKQSGHFFTFSPLAIGDNLLYYRTKTDAKAIYGQLDYKLTDSLTGTLGVRRSWEEKQGDLWKQYGPLHAVSGQTPGTFVPGFSPQSNKAKFSATTPVAALSYKLNPQLTVFGRVAKGFKSGGFPLEAQTAAQAMTPYHQETSTAFELGAKSSFNDGKAQLNATIFSTDVNEYHINQLPPGGISPVTVNAGKLKSEGLEVEGVYQLADGWRLQATYGYLHMKFKEYNTFNPLGVIVNIADNTVASYAPKHQLTLNLDGRLARTPIGILRGIVDYSYTSSYLNYHGQITPVGTNVAIGNTVEESTLPSLSMVNARLLLTGVPIGGPGTGELSLWVRNLTNVKKQATHIDLAGFYRIAGWTDPRMVGMSFNYKW